MELMQYTGLLKIVNGWYNNALMMKLQENFSDWVNLQICQDSLPHSSI
jgi:hypothetical protein